jgi:hypothetical protein
MKRSELKRRTPLRSSSTIKAKPAKEPKVRLRRCAVKSCRTPFAPKSMLHKCCSQPCAEAFVAAEKARKLRKERQEGLAKLKRRADYLKETQQAFNAYRREWCQRNGFSNCPSCGCHLNWTANQVDAGHYRSVGSAPHLRFTEDNVWAQCKKCNRFAGGRVVEYRKGLEHRIGPERLAALEADDQPRKWPVAELVAIRDTYRSKLRELQKGTV